MTTAKAYLAVSGCMQGKRTLLFRAACKMRLVRYSSWLWRQGLIGCARSPFEG